MYVTSQLVDFIEFILIGNIIGTVFDFFRAYRKIRKVSSSIVVIQDIIYFLIVTIIITLSIIKMLDSQIRLYIFIAIILGCSTYFCLFSKIVLKGYVLFINMFREIVKTFFLPILLDIQIFRKIGRFLKKIMKKCCKMFSFVLFFIYKRESKGKSKKINKKPCDKDKRGLKFMKNKKASNEINDKNKKKKKLGLVHLFMICFGIYFVYTFISQQIQINKYDSQIKMYTADIKTKKDLTEYYNSQKSNTDSDKYIENVARESLGYVKPYEKIFIDVNK